MSSRHSAQRARVGQAKSDNFSQPSQSNREPLALPYAGGVVRPPDPSILYANWFQEEVQRSDNARAKKQFRKARRNHRLELKARADELRSWLAIHAASKATETFQLRLAELQQIEMELAQTTRKKSKVEILSIVSPDGVETPEQAAWINAYRNSTDPFAGFITASRYKAIHGNWPNGIKPNAPSFKNIPVWKAKWLLAQSSLDRMRHRREVIRERKRQQREALAAEILAMSSDQPLPIKLTSLGELVLNRKSRKARAA